MTSRPLRIVAKFLILLGRPLSLSTTYADVRNQVSLRMVMRHQDLLFAIACIKSFYLRAEIIANCYIHIDRSVSTFDRLLLRYHIPFVKFILYDTANAPNASPLDKIIDSWQGQKLIQMVIQSDTPKILILDADILFFRKPEYILQWIERGRENIFMEDTASFNAFSTGEFSYYFHLPRITDHINTGIAGIVKSTKLVNVHTLSKFFKKAPVILNDRLIPGYEKYYLDNAWHIIEQTAYTYLLSNQYQHTHVKTYLLLPKKDYQLIARLVTKPKPITTPVAIHYAGSLTLKRHFFEDYLSARAYSISTQSFL